MKGIISHFTVRAPKWFISWLILGIDIISALLVFSKIFSPRLSESNINSSNQILLFFLMQFILSSLFFFANLYKGDFTTSRVAETTSIVRLTFILATLWIAVDAVSGFLLPIKALDVFIFWLWYISMVVPLRVLIRTFQKILLQHGIGRENTLLIGLNNRGIQAADNLMKHKLQGYFVKGFVCVNEEKSFKKAKYPILGNMHDLKKVIINEKITEVVLSLDKPNHEQVMNIITKINGLPVSIKILPDLYGIISGLARTEQIVGMPLIEISSAVETWYIRVFKRFFDLIVAIPSVVILSPLYMIIATIIKLNSKGSALYIQTRVGLKGRHFNAYKFRSMIADAEKHSGPVWAGDKDPRITSVGRVLRRFRLDEFPQLLNVIKGDMSIIGPRPERPFFVDKLREKFPFYDRRLIVRPGISGWAQIKHPYDRNIEDVRQKLKYDFYYIENLSFGLDIKIMLSTVLVILSGKGR